MLDPYSNPEIVARYEQRYLTNSVVAHETAYEVRLVEQVLNAYGYRSWCDVACGTGYHLRAVNSPVAKTGFDRSAEMLAVWSDQMRVDIAHGVVDILTMDTYLKYDLVTNFWFGYTHQPTLQDVVGFFKQMIELTNTGGSVILSIHNNWKMFDTFDYKTPEPMGGEFKFDAMHWSYHEPGNPEYVYNCISPHKGLIIETFEPHFAAWSIFYYPGDYQGREILVFKQKK